MTTLLKLAAISLTVASVSVGVADPAAAQDKLQARVAIKDIDLTTAKGQRIFARRVNRAANLLCDDANEHLDITVRKASSVCRANVSRGANSAIAAKSVELAIR
jgi:UrcA family protein